MTAYTSVPPTTVIERTVQALKERTNVDALVVEDKRQALEALIDQIPEGAEIINNQSITLMEIGFVDYLSQNPSRYRNLRSLLLAEPEPSRRMELRRRVSVVDYNIGSVNAVAETGELVFASHSGSQLVTYAFTARHVIWVVGAQKIVPTLEDAIRRVREYAHPLEDRRIGRMDPSQRSRIGKWLILENEWSAERALMILVKEPLGF